MLTPNDEWDYLPPLSDDDVPPDYDHYPEPDVPDADVREFAAAAETVAESQPSEDEGDATSEDSEAPTADAPYPLHADGHPGSPLTLRDRESLVAKRGLTETFLSTPHVAATVRSITDASQLPANMRWCVDADPTGILYLWTDPKTGAQVPQFRPNAPSSPDAKYVFPKGSGSPVWLVSGALPDLKHTVYVVEGTNQSLAWASAYAHDPAVVVVAIAGCHGGVRNGVLHPGLAYVVRRASKVVIVPDGDVASNRRVYDAYTTLGDRIRGYMRAHGDGRRSTVSFVQIHADADDPTAGADDLLSQTPELERHALLEELTALSISTPSEVRPPADRRRRPASTGASDEDTEAGVYFSQFGGGLRSKACAEAVLERHDLLLDLHSSVLYTYDTTEGIYVPDRNSGTKSPSAPIADVLTDIVGDDYRSGHVASVEDHVHKALMKAGRTLPEQPLTQGLLPTRNCLVDMETGETFPHAPEARVVAKLNVAYDTTAQAPTFEKWIREATLLSDGTDQMDIILDALTTLLDTAAGISQPTIALYLYGPPRAGKGTMGRLIQAMVPVWAQTAMSLADMAVAKPFDTAVLYRKLLNISGETSDNYITDTALMKMIFGEDYLKGELKFGKAWTFKNSAATVFMGNDLPHFSDVSGATGARIQPLKFTKSHVGQEDRTLYATLEEELPGILNLIIEAWRARKARKGSFLSAAPEAVEAFIEATNPVATFMRDRVEKAPEEAWADPRTGAPTQSVEPEWGTTVTEMYTAYKAYVDSTGAGRLKRERFLKAISRAPFNIREGRTRDRQRRVLGCRLISEDDDAPTIVMSTGNGTVDIALTGSQVEAQALREEQARARAKANIDRVVRLDTSSMRTPATASNAFGEGTGL